MKEILMYECVQTFASNDANWDFTGYRAQVLYMTAAHHQQEMQLALVQASHCDTLSVTNTVKTS